MKIKPGTVLDCGCCGTVFATWKGYKHQDQDEGFGICLDCQEWGKKKDLEHFTKDWGRPPIENWKPSY